MGQLPSRFHVVSSLRLWLLVAGECFRIDLEQLDRFHDHFVVAGGKDDRRDAHTLANTLGADRCAFRPVRIDAANWIEVRVESHNYEDLRVDFTRLTNRLRELPGSLPTGRCSHSVTPASPLAPSSAGASRQEPHSVWGTGYRG